MNLEQVGEVSIQGVAGEAIPAKLVKVDVRICETPIDTDEETRTNQVKFTITPYVSLVCAYVAGMGSKEKFLLHPEIIAELKTIPQVIIKREEVQANVITRAQRLQKEPEEAKASHEEERENEGKNENESKSDETSDDESIITSDRIRQENDACESDNLLESEDSDEDTRDKGLPIASLFEEAVEDGEQVMQRADAEKFEVEQQSDESLKAWWKLAEDKQSELCVVNGLLYKKHRILDQVIYQVVLPKERRIKVMSLAHEEPFEGHVGEEKTKERIKLSFVWPMKRREIDKFCKSCEKCQLKARSLVMDRVPITPIPREDVAFKRMTRDVVGPIEPTSAAGHQCCLCIVDSCTRWPAVYLLKSLTAKAVCEELKNLFMDVGVPSVITSDQGTNFTSSLTKEFLKVFGVTPRFNTPGHPESSEIVEKWNQTFKKMIQHVIIDNP